ncbi:MAG: hypothetical protein MJ230_07895 [bacterium]|nr:hypothetical protein [bacterium]
MKKLIPKGSAIFRTKKSAEKMLFIVSVKNPRYLKINRHPTFNIMSATKRSFFRRQFWDDLKYKSEQ